MCSLSDTGDTASNLGSAVDELMRHQPTLKTDATTAIIKVLYIALQVLLQVWWQSMADKT